jgi:hypothetical protein
MTTYESLSLVVSIAGFFGVAVSIWVFNRQAQIFRQQLMQNLSTDLNKSAREISLIFLQYPELRPYFFDGQPMEQEHPDYYRAEAVAEVMLDIFWTMTSQTRRIRDGDISTGDARSLWANYVGECFAQSPMLCKFLTRHKDWYGPEMVRWMEQGVAHTKQRVA